MVVIHILQYAPLRFSIQLQRILSIPRACLINALVALDKVGVRFSVNHHRHQALLAWVYHFGPEVLAQAKGCKKYSSVPEDSVG